MKKLLFTMFLLTALAFAGGAQVTILSEGFENGTVPAGWTILDADNDGHAWEHSSFSGVLGGHTGENSFVSFSVDNSTGNALFPNDWLVSPAITLAGNSTLSFYRMVGYFSYAEHYGVYISTTSPTDPSSFTLLFEETPTHETYAWAMRTVDLSAYTGQTVYIAFRHFNSSDQLVLGLDDITVTTLATTPFITALPTALQFLDVPVGAPSAAQTLTVEGYNITGGIDVTVNAPFEVSLDNNNFSYFVTIPDTSNTLYVRYFPTNGGADSSSLTLTNGSAYTEVPLYGTSVECGNISLPYVQNFNSTSENDIPECWQRINSFDGYPKTTDDYTSQGDNVLMFKCDYSTYEPIYAVLPMMPSDLNTLQISFYTFREGSWSGTLSVGYVTNPADSSTFVPVWSINAAQIGDNNPHPYIVGFNNVTLDPSSNYYITFKYETSSNWYWFVDDITVEELPSCGAPGSLQTNQVTSTSAVLSWYGTDGNYNIYYKTSYDTSWTEILNVSYDTAGYLLDNLLPATAYTWYVANVCPDGSIVSSLGNATFTTECAVFSAPFSQSFDGSTNLPQCWGRYDGLASNVFAGTSLSPTTSGWVFNNTNVFGANHPKVNIYGTSVSKWLVTPAIDLSGVSSPVLMFDLALTAWNSTSAISNPTGQPDDKFMVIVSTDLGATWSASNATVWSNDGNGDYVYNQISNTGQEITISLADYANQTVMIAFYGESTVSNGDNDLHIDNVMVAGATSCAKPTNLSLVATTSTSVTLSWTENGTATAWNIEYGPAGYVQGSSSGTLEPASTNPFSLGGLSSIAYDFYVQADCGGEQSLWVGPITVTPGAYNMGTSGSDTLTACSLTIYDNGGAAGNYSASCDYTLVLYPETAGVSVAIAGTYVTESCCDYLRIFDGADTNNTMLGDFRGTGTISAVVASNGPLTLYFHSDGGMQYSGFELTTSCVTCSPPGNVTASNITPNSADLTWTGSVSSYKVEYKADGDAAWTTEIVTDTTLSLVNLTDLTTYTVNVYSNCGGEFSPAATITFHTPMIATPIPYSTDFSATNDWVFNNGYSSTYWMIGNAGGGNNAMFVTTNGSTPGYNIGSFAAVSAEKMFTVGDAAELAISFDVKVGGEGAFDYLKVFLAPADQEYPAATTNVAYTNETYSEYAVNFTDFLQYSSYPSYPYKFNLTGNNTVHIGVMMPNPNQNPTATSTAKLVFLWKNDSSGGEQPGAVVDNVEIAALTCTTPTNLTVTNVTTTSADIQWTAGGDEDEWELEYKPLADSIWIPVSVMGLPSYNLAALNVGTSYQVRVRAVCSTTDQSMWAVVDFTTPCDAVITFPYTEDFENGGLMPDCWSQEHVVGVANWEFRAGTPSSNGIPSAHSGSYNASFYQASHDGITTRLVTPIFDLSNVSNPYVSYWYAMKDWSGDLDHLTVYYRTSPSGQWQQLVQYYTSVSVWTMDSLALPNPSATYQLAFTGLADWGYGIVLDDITIGEAAGGPAVVDPTVATNAADPVAQTTATLHATITNPDNVTITAKGFEWRATAGGANTQVAGTGTGNTFTANLSNLNPSTSYTYKAFITFNGTTVYGSEMTFTTLEQGDEPCDVPTGLHVTSVENEAIAIAWDANASVNSWNIHYRPQNGTWNSATSNTNSYTITGLTGHTTYEIQVQADCGDGNVSDWSGSVSEETTNVGIEEWLENSVTLFPNPAKDVVNVECTMNNVQGVEVYDVFGKVVQIVGLPQCDSPTTRINVAGLADGVYFVRVTTDRGVVTKSFVKR
jgi:hypothetical protein